MRFALILACVILATTASAETLRAGSYASTPAQSPAACARACAEDGLCMLWVFQDNACAMSAVVSEAPLPAGGVAGLSSRAPSFARLPAAAPPVAASDPERPRPVRAARIETTAALLGGPEEGDLRLRR